MFKPKNGFFAALFLSIALFSSSVFSYAYSPFSLITGKGTFAVNPYIFGDAISSDARCGAELFLAYGATEKVDLWFSLNTYNEFSLMARYDLGKPGIIALRGNQHYIAPQYHLTLENEQFALQANAGASFAYADEGKPDLFAIVAPVVKFFGGMVDIYCEANPSYSVAGETFQLDVVPGVGFAVGDVLFSVACPIYDVTNNPTPTFGAWAFFAIGG